MIVHLMAPGLCRRHLDADWLELGNDTPSVRADLVCTFPATIETVEATLVTGTEPTLHGVWSAERERERPCSEKGVEHLRDDRVARARCENPDDVRALREAVAGIGDLVRTVRDRCEQLIVSGGPAFASTPRRVEPPTGWIACGSMALCESEATADERSSLLATPGVARVLDGDGLRSWHGLPIAHAAIAEPGWTFTDQASACGRRDLDGTGDGAVVLAWGPRPDSWPRAVHDLRIAPTLARVVGCTLESAVDGPLRWS